MKIKTRLFVVLLVPCLLVDPSTAAAIATERIPPGLSCSLGPSSSLFRQEALQLVEIWALSSRLFERFSAKVWKREFSLDRPKASWFTPAAMGFWLYFGWNNLVTIGGLEGLIWMIAISYRMRHVYELHPGHFDTESLTEHTIGLIKSELPVLGLMVAGIFVAHYLFGVILPYQTRRPFYRSLKHSFRATLVSCTALIGLPFVVLGSFGESIGFVFVELAGWLMGAIIPALFNMLIFLRAPHPFGPRMRMKFRTFPNLRPKSTSDDLIRKIINLYTNLPIDHIEWAPGGYKGFPFPVVTTFIGEQFAVKKMNVANLSEAIFIVDYLSHLQDHSIPIPLLPKRRAGGDTADDFIYKFDNPIRREPEYYMVQHFIDAGINVSRGQAQPSHLRALGRMLGRIHNASTTFHTRSGIGRSFSFRGVLDAVGGPLSKWESALDIHLSQHEKAILSAAILQTRHYWTRDRLEGLTMHAIPSDMNFSGVKFDFKERDIISIFDWDDSRIGYRIEDFFASVVQGGEPGLYVRSMRRNLEYLLEGYSSTIDTPLTQAELDVIPAMFEAQLLWKVASRSKQLTSSAAKNRQYLEIIHTAISGLGQLHSDFKDWPGDLAVDHSFDVTMLKPSKLAAGLQSREIHVDGQFVKATGEIFTIDLAHYTPLQHYTDGIRHRDVSDEPLVTEDPEGGFTIDQYVQGREDVVLGFNSTQGQLLDPNTVLIVEGHLVVRNPKKRGLRQSRKTVVLKGPFSVFSLDPDHKGIFDIQFIDGRLGAPLPVKDGFAGPLILRDGQSRMSEILFNRRPPTSGNQLGWRSSKQTSALTAFGFDQSGRMVVVQIGGDPLDGRTYELTLAQFVEVLIKLGVKDAILGGTSGDVQRYSKFSKPPLLWYRARAGSKLQPKLADTEGHRRLSTVILFVAKSTQKPFLKRVFNVFSHKRFPRILEESV